MNRRALLGGISGLALMSGCANASILTLKGVAVPPSGAATVNTVLPTVSGSTPVGSTLTAANGTWTGSPSPTFTYQWTTNGSNIGGATSSTYVTQSGDTGNAIGCAVTGTNSHGSATAASSNTITVTSASIPASVNMPVQGTDLTAIWNLQFSGTGPRSGATNGTWAGTIDAYLTGKGFVAANHDGAIYLDVGSSTVTIANYDFTTCPAITINGTGSAIFNDCVMPDVGAFLGNSITAPTDINGNTNITSSTLTIDCNYCLFNIGTFFVGSGSWNNSHCRFSNQIQQIGGCTNGNLSFDFCWISGGGCAPPNGAHVEYIQFNSVLGLAFSVTNTLCTLSDGAATAPPYGVGGWTALWSTTSTAGNQGSMTFQNSIFIGVTEVDNNPANPNKIGGTVHYGQGQVVVVTNCILENATGAPGGYTSNGNSGASRPTVSGDRTFGNAALNSGDFN